MRLYQPKITSDDMFKQGWEVANKIMGENEKQLEDIDEEAVRAGTIIGRYITEPVADGSAFYQIIKENKKTVRLRVCTGLGDDWTVNYWGSEATVDKDYVMNKLAFKDTMRKLFVSKK